MTDASQLMPYSSSTSKQPFRVGRSEREPQTTATVGIGPKDTNRYGPMPVDSTPRWSPGIVAELRPIPGLQLAGRNVGAGLGALERHAGDAPSRGLASRLDGRTSADHRHHPTPARLVAAVSRASRAGM